MKWFVLAVSVMMYALVICFQDKKVFWSLGAAALFVALGTFFPAGVFEGGGGLFAVRHCFADLINWNVLMIYIGSMIIAALFIYSKAPSRAADEIIKLSPSAGIAIVLILAMTGIISIFVENVATVLVMAPIALALCKKLELDRKLYSVSISSISKMFMACEAKSHSPCLIYY